MKTATLFTLAATALVAVSAAPREVKVRAAEPEPYPEPYPEAYPEPYPEANPEPYPEPEPEPYPEPEPEPYPEPEPEPYPEPEPEPSPDNDDDDDENDPNNNPPTDGVMCGITGAPRVAAPDLTTAQSASGFIGQINAKKGSINGAGGNNVCTQVSCANGVGVSFCNDSPFPSTVAYSTIGKYAYDLAVVCFDGGKTNNGRKTYLDFQTDNRWYVTIGGATC